MSFYLVDKAANVTSHDVVQDIKSKTGVKKAGHSGTLDPFATGLLIIATDEDTKFLDRFLNKSKTYEGEMKFGIKTNTYDLTGEVSDQDENFELDESKLKKIINDKFIGKINQIPPIFSSTRVNGKHAYELARANKEVNLKPVERIIYSFDIKQSSKNIIKFRVHVSSGTYIRALARDLGKELNTNAIITKLRRTKIDLWSLNDAKQLNATTQDNLKAISRKDFLNIKEFNVSQINMKHILEGKIFNYNSELKEFIVVNNDVFVLMKRIGLNKYFINKRIK